MARDIVVSMEWLETELAWLEAATNKTDQQRQTYLALRELYNWRRRKAAVAQLIEGINKGDK